MEQFKTCTKCQQYKELTEGFYKCAGKYKSECKKCTIKRNVKYQQEQQSWKYRYKDDDTRKLYMRNYYSKNKEKFAEYRRRFIERFPGYFKDYFEARKNRV
jgi:hypothetical protein